MCVRCHASVRLPCLDHRDADTVLDASEWIEEFQTILSDRTVAHLNVDLAVIHTFNMLGMVSVFSELLTSYGSIIAVYYIYVYVLSFHYILHYIDASNTVNVCAFTEGLFTLLCMMIMMVVVVLECL